MLREKDKRLFTGSNVSAEVFNREWPDHVGSSRERIIHMGSPEFGLGNLAKLGGASGSQTWSSANKPVGVPFRVFKGMTVYQLAWRNGSGTMTDSMDVGVYDAAFNRKVSGGGTARAGISSIQWVDVTDTFLPVGKYYLVGASNGVTANNAASVIASLSAVMLAGLGCQDSATNSYPLPDPLVGMAAAATFTFVPWMAIGARVPF